MTPRLRCAIYTRKSTEEGLEQEFNSLDAQRQSCEAYIASQRSLRWTCLAARYDDGGISGGTMDRPALQRLLADIKASRVDLIVVYKIDRLTRSLADFAKLVEVFEAHNVSFVSVTQQFNTTTSMGRLTLNVLLSFAQFEREVTGERIRDKIAVSKRKVLWMGGTVPLGYDLKDRKLVVNEAEAEAVRTLFRIYRKLGTVKALMAEARRLGMLTKKRQRRDGTESGGRPFARGHLYWLLRNPIYVGEIAHRGNRHPGQHPAIIDRQTYEAAQRQLQGNASRQHAAIRAASPSLLTGLVYDEMGDRLCPTHARKMGRRYRYYISKRLMHRSPSVEGGWRLPAKSFEDLVVKAIAAFLRDELRIVEALGAFGAAPEQLLGILERLRTSASLLTGQEPTECRAMLERLVHRITLRSGTLGILIKRAGLLPSTAEDHAVTAPAEPHYELSVPIALRRRGVEAKLIICSPEEVTGQIDEKLQALVAAAHSRLHRLASGEIESVIDLAKAEKVDPSDIGRSLQVAFLAPDIVEAIVEGWQPVELTAWQLRRIGYLPLAWEEQRRLLGFPVSHS